MNAMKQMNKMMDSKPVQPSPTKVTKVAYEEPEAPVVDVTPKDMAAGPQNKGNLSGTAKKWLQKLEALVKSKSGEELADMIFDAECDDVGEELDLQWYENKAAEFIEEA